MSLLGKRGGPDDNNDRDVRQRTGDVASEVDAQDETKTRKRKAPGDNNDRDVRPRTDDGESEVDAQGETKTRFYNYSYKCTTIKTGNDRYMDTKVILVSADGNIFKMNYSACMHSQLLQTMLTGVRVDEEEEEDSDEEEEEQEIPLPELPVPAIYNNGYEGLPRIKLRDGQPGLLELVCEFLRMRHLESQNWESHLVEENRGQDTVAVIPRPITREWFENNYFAEWVQNIQPDVMLMHLMKASRYMQCWDLYNLCAVEIGRRATSSSIEPNDMDFMFGNSKENGRRLEMKLLIRELQLLFTEQTLTPKQQKVSIEIDELYDKLLEANTDEFENKSEAVKEAAQRLLAMKDVIHSITGVGETKQDDVWEKLIRKVDILLKLEMTEE